MPSEQHYQFQRLRSLVILSGVLLAKIASSERSWGDLHIDGDRSWQTTTLPVESEGEEEKPQGSIAYAALHARTEAFLKASRNYQVAVKGPLMDATDVYLQQKERYERFAHNLDKGERQQHKLIHMMRSSLRKHHGHKMEEFQKTLEAERAEKKATGEDANEDEDEDEDSEETDDSEESGDSGSAESESEEGRVERNDESAPADSDSKGESEKKSKESAAPNANSEEHHENPEKESKAKEQKQSSGKEEDLSSKGCDARKKAKQGTEEWCRCNANAELIKTRSPCEDQGGGRKDACVWSVETRSCIPRKRGKPWK